MIRKNMDYNSNKKTYKEFRDYDLNKYKFANENVYKILVIQESEYLNNKNEIIKKLKFYIIILIPINILYKNTIHENKKNH